VLEIGNHFQSEQNYYQAGKHYLQALHYPEALKMFLIPKDDNKSIEMAIETIGEAKNDTLTHELIDFLMGEHDGIPKDAKYIFKLYMSLEQFQEASRTAIIIAREEQNMGNYRSAHDLLFDNYNQLRRIGSPVPLELSKMLMILHSYMLVKVNFD
jgi:WD repeat-containing protein 19